MTQNLAAAAETEAKARAAPAKGEQAAPEWLSLGRQAIGAGGARPTADEFWASPTHPPVAVLTAEAERLRSQLVGERSAVQLSHRAHLAEARAATEQQPRSRELHRLVLGIYIQIEYIWGERETGYRKT